jgi:hypothetical protein
VNAHSLAIVAHIGGGGIAIGAGAAALYFRKGGRMHAKAGTWFFASMLLLLTTGAVMAAIGASRGVAVSAVLTLYLVATSRATARRRDGKAGRFELFALLVAIGCAVADFSFGLQAVASPTGRLDGFSPGPYFVFAGLAALAAGLDLNFILRRGVSRAQRIARHLWRMSAALLIAALSFFLGQQKVMPESWHGAFWLFLPPLAVLGLMVFWLLRVRFSGAYKRRAPAIA